MNQEEKTLDECCSFEHKWKIARGHISKSIRRTRLKFSPRESTTTITLCAKFNRNLRCRVLFRDFFGRSVVECPTCNPSSFYELFTGFLRHACTQVYPVLRRGTQMCVRGTYSRLVPGGAGCRVRDTHGSLTVSVRSRWRPLLSLRQGVDVGGHFTHSHPSQHDIVRVKARRAESQRGLSSHSRAGSSRSKHSEALRHHRSHNSPKITEKNHHTLHTNPWNPS